MLILLSEKVIKNLKTSQWIHHNKKLKLKPAFFRFKNKLARRVCFNETFSMQIRSDYEAACILEQSQSIAEVIVRGGWGAVLVVRAVAECRIISEYWFAGGQQNWPASVDRLKG